MSRVRARDSARVWPLIHRLALLASELRGVLEAMVLIWSTDILVMSGTGMLSDTGESSFGLPFEIAKWSLAAKICGCRLFFVSVGAEGFAHPLSRFLTRMALRLADYRSYRDDLSRQRIRRIGFPADKDPVFPDLAFSLPDATGEVQRSAAVARPQVAVGLYDYHSRAQGCGRAAYLDYVQKMAVFVGWLRQNAYSVRIVIADLQYDQAVRADLRKALEAAGVASSGLVDEPATSVAQLMTQLAAADLVVATRFHTVLLSLVLGKPVVSISYDDKNEALMAGMGLSEYCQRIGELDVGLLTRQFQDLQERAASLVPRILATASGHRDELERQYRDIFELG